MAAKGVCTSPKGVTGCTSSTCPGGSINANLGALRTNDDNNHRSILANAISEDLFDLKPDERVKVLDALSADERNLVEGSKMFRMQAECESALEAAVEKHKNEGRYSYDPFINTKYLKAFREAFKAKFFENFEPEN